MSQFDSPTPPEFDTTGEPPAWPKVVGIFSIVWGSLGIPCGLCAGFVTLAMGPFMEWAAQMQQQGGNRGGGPTLPTTQLPAELSPGPLSMLGAVIWPISVMLLIGAGIMLLRRRAAGRTLHLAYAVVSLLGTLAGLIGAWTYSKSASSFIALHPDDPWSQFFTAQSGGPSGQFIQSIAISCFSFIYPAFILLWFLVVKRKPSDMGVVLREPII